MFDALVHRRIATGIYDLSVSLADIEELNRNVISGIPDISKISTALYPQVSESYQILAAGAAIGTNNGPVLISDRDRTIPELADKTIAIPGLHTTANLLLSIAFPEIVNKTEVRFSDIEQALLNYQYAAGLIIHESRFTYEQKGLKKIVDLGEYWQQTYKKLIPLGLIVVKRTLPEHVKKQIEQLISTSVQHAFRYPADSDAYIKANAQEMADQVVRQHIALYVNKYSEHMGDTGKEAIRFLFSEAAGRGLLPKIHTKDIFLNE